MTANDGSCSEITSFNTTYNSDNERVIPVAGIMFSMRTRSNPIDVLTLELDVLDTLSETDVQVYTRRGEYGAVMDDASQWTLVANTRLVQRRADGGGAVVLPSRFAPVHIPKGTLQSFFVTVNGPWLDSLLNPLDQVGRLDVETPDFEIFTGSAIFRHGFPRDTSNHYVATFSPRLAATVHYAVQECLASESTKDTFTTPIHYEFFVNLPVDVLRMADSVRTTILSAARQVLVSQLHTDSVLAGHSLHSGLRHVGMGDVSVHDPYSTCPANWDTGCAHATVSFKLEHHVTLPSGLLEYELYSMSSLVAQAVQSQLKALSRQARNSMSVLSSYVGYQGVAADYQLLLRSVPNQAAMDWRQARYLQQTTEDYLKKTLSVTHMKIESQRHIANQPGEHLRSLQQQASILVVNGTIYGKQMRFPQIAEPFSEQLQNAATGDGLVDDLSFNYLLPKHSRYLNQDEFEYFARMKVVDLLATESSPRIYTPAGGNGAGRFQPTKQNWGDDLNSSREDSEATSSGSLMNDMKHRIQSINTKTWIIASAVLVALVVLALVIIFPFRRRRRRRQQQRMVGKSTERVVEEEESETVCWHEETATSTEY